MGQKRQVTFLINEADLKELEKLRDETGIPLSRLIELKLRGYEVRKVDAEHRT